MAFLASFAVAFALALLTPLAAALSATGQRVLVILPSTSQQSTYSSFLSDLSNRGFQLTYREEKAPSSNVALTAFDERQYDHLVFFPSSASSTPSADLTPQALVSFVRKGGNILFGYGSDRPDWLQDLAREFSLELAGSGQKLVDHFQYSTAQGDHSTVVLGGGEGDAGGLVSNNIVFSAETLQAASSQPLLVGSASPHRLGPNPLAFPLVGTSATSYTAAKEDGEVGFLGTDEDAAIASAFQTKENTRVAFVGSQELFSDSLLGAKDVKSSSGKR
jgi:oligosaccharyltransferase complex subunit beta